MKEIIIVMLSGGLDSTYVLYDYLANTDFDIHAHHMSLKYPEINRWEQELTASRAVVEYCQKNYRAFGYSESSMEFPFSETGWDSDLCLLTAVRVAQNLNTDLVSVALGWTIDDVTRPIMLARIKRKAVQSLWDALKNSVDPNLSGILNDKYYHPIVDKKFGKTEIIAEMPNDLFRLTWSCRTPIGRLQCGECASCIDVHEALQKHSGPI